MSLQHYSQSRRQSRSRLCLVKNPYASESDFGWCQKVFLDHPPNQNSYFVYDSDSDA